MIVRRVRLNNFLGHRDSEATFQPEGVHFLSGVSGAGKSSLIVDAVSFALFGVQATRADKTEDLHYRGEEGKDFEVFCAFENPDGTQFEITRGVSAQGKSYARLVDSHGGFAEGPDPVKRRLRELIGNITTQTFYRSFVAEQGKLGGIADMPTSERKNFVHSMLGIDVLDRVAKLARQRATSERTLREHLLESIGQINLPAIEEQLEHWQEEMNSLEQEIEAHESRAKQELARADEVELLIKPLRDRLAALNAQQSALSVLESRLPELAQRQQLLSEAATRLLEASRAVSERDSVLQEGKTLRARIDALRAQEEALGEYSGARRRQNELDAAIAALEEQFLKLNEQYSEFITPPASPETTAAEEGAEPTTAAAPGLERESSSLEGAELRKSERLLQEREQIKAEGGGVAAEIKKLEQALGQLLEEHVCTTCLRPVEGEDANRIEGDFQALIDQGCRERELLTERYRIVSAELEQALQSERRHDQYLRDRDRIQDQLAAVRRDREQLGKTIATLEERMVAAGISITTKTKSGQAGADVDVDADVAADIDADAEVDTASSGAEFLEDGGLGDPPSQEIGLDRGRLKREIEELEGRRADLIAQLALIDDQKRWIEENPDILQDLESIEADIAGTQAERDRIAAEIAASDLRPEQAEELEQEERAARQAAAVAREEQRQLEGKLTTLREQRAGFTATVEAHRGTSEQLAACAERITRFTELAALVTAFRTQLAGEIRPQLEEICSQVMNLLSNGYHAKVQIDENYGIEVETPNGWLPYSLASGGERARLAIALRVGLSRLVTQRTGTPVRFLVLDEVFGSQDPGHREHIMEVLRALRNFYPQVFLISHVGDLAEAGVVDYQLELPPLGTPAGQIPLRAL